MNRRTRLRLTVLLAALGAAFGTTGMTANWSDGLQRQAEDLLQPGTERSNDIVVVVIDRSTLAAVGEAWPWPRVRHAELITEIAAGDPDAIAYDILFADERPDDDPLEAAIQMAPVVLASALTLQETGGPPLIVESVEPTARLGAAAAAVGHANVTLTPDRGVVRTLPLYAVDDRGVVTPSLTLATIAVVEGSSQYIERPDGIQVGFRFIPLDGGDLRINWADGLDAGDGSAISALDVLVGRIPPGSFSGKTVVVGVTEPTLGDLHLVPTDKSGSTSGVMVHANALNTLLTESYLAEAGTGLQVALLILLATLGAVAFMWLALRWALVLAAIAVAAIIGLSAWRFNSHGELWNVVWPIVTIVVIATVGSAARYAGEIRHRRRAAELFASYVPAGTLDQLADADVLDRAVAGERLVVTVLFCDLRGFTPTASTLTADEVRRLLEIFYAYTVQIIGAHGGTVLQFVGDEVFAVFGAPIPSDDDHERGVACARALIDEVAEFDRRLTGEGLPTIRFGIGLHRGEVVAAHVGGSLHRQYTVLGDPVNVGSRLCGQAGAGEVVLSDAACVGVRTEGMERIAALDLEGVDQQVAGWRIRSR